MKGLSITLVVALSAPALAHADVVKLNSGGEVRGVVVEPTDSTAGVDDDVVTIETLTGGKISILRADVAFITQRPRILEEHEVKARTAPNTVAAQWELAEWCLSNDLEEQRTEHLLNVVALEHDHAEARAALGQKNYDGEWMTRDELMRGRGLVEHKGRWGTPQELELIEKTAAEREREQAWFAEIRKLHSWLRGTSDDLRRKSLAQLKALRDPDAVPALAKFFRDAPEPEVRVLYVSVLSEMPGPKPVVALVTQALHDIDRQVRDTAFEAIDESRHDAALPYFLQGLRNEQNVVVRRAGRGLEQVADERAIPDLIKALITSHRYRIRVPDNSQTITMSSNGTFGSGGVPLPPDIALALRAGALPNGVFVVDPTQPVRTRLVTVTVNEENPEVLSALRTITGESFGFDERTWRLWWTAKKNGAG
ncbi:MAG: HEAT repeat domain-containing protein [Planctomycetota bacterium]|nr:HEAT repeat domain-containing protein [Planctomycetota bacterium]